MSFEESQQAMQESIKITRQELTSTVSRFSNSFPDAEDQEQLGKLKEIEALIDQARQKLFDLEY